MILIASTASIALEGRAMAISKMLFIAVFLNSILASLLPSMVLKYLIASAAVFGIILLILPKTLVT